MFAFFEEGIIIKPNIHFPQFNLNLLSSAQILSVGYTTVILIGAVLLMLPIATNDGEGLRFVDALFTATSATCVTGLAVVTTQTAFTLFGKIVIMFLIQIGGLGIMTMSTAFALITGRRITLRQRLIIQEDLKQFEISGLLRLIQYILAVTFTIEGAGALVLFTRLVREYPIKEAAFGAIFHSVSAFNNAGFDLFGNSLEGYVGDFTINITIMLLIILGGLGFAVLAEIYDKRKLCSLHAKMVVTMTVTLILVGWVMFFFLEGHNPDTLGNLKLSEKLLGSLFLSVTPRTAGFSSVPTGALYQSSLLFVMLLMFIGASPGSTGGGIKTTTAGTLLAHLWARIRGNDDVEIFDRRLEEDAFIKASTTLLTALILVFSVCFLLTITEEVPLRALLFETISAFGTVGLSTGITPGLTDFGRILIALTMLAGRVGPLTLVMAMSESKKKAQFHYPKEKIMVG